MSESVNDYRHLPDPIRIEETIVSLCADIAADPEAGRNVDQDRAVGHRELS
ncbi:hypothetical protein [Kribbella sp. CA-294648]|uniref:hypothetical protein n=1 Tax=Kribbella sp. CA-294648 TaxID=3239948 RepID=UPI003D8F5785